MQRWLANEHFCQRSGYSHRRGANKDFFLLIRTAAVKHNVVMCVCVRMIMLSNEDTYMNFNLNTVDVPSNEDGPRSSDIGNDFNIT